MLRLATTARFYVTIGKKSKSVKSTTYSVVARLHVFRDTSFLLLLYYMKEIGLLQGFHPLLTYVA